MHNINSYISFQFSYSVAEYKPGFSYLHIFHNVLRIPDIPLLLIPNDRKEIPQEIPWIICNNSFKKNILWFFPSFAISVFLFNSLVFVFQAIKENIHRKEKILRIQNTKSFCIVLEFIFPSFPELLFKATKIWMAKMLKKSKLKTIIELWKTEIRRG